MSARIDLTGKRFGGWKVLEYAGYSESKKPMWLCVCDCGERRDVEGQSLRNGLTSSCGCQKGLAIAKARRTHGASYKKSYQVWRDMMRRCTVKSSPNWRHYGGRGISVCERWQSYENFVADMGEPPEDLTLERNDNDGNYELSNCRWATVAEQNRNKRTSRR